MFCLLITALSVATAIAAPAAFNIDKRWDENLCTPALSNVPIPDGVSFTLPLENTRQTQYFDLCMSDSTSCTGQLFWNFVNETLIIDFQPYTGYLYTSADIFLGLSAPSDTPTANYTTANGGCTLISGGQSVHCVFPWSQIVGKTAELDVLSAMCPYGDQAALILYVYTTAQLVNTATNATVTAVNRKACSDWSACTQYYPYPYFELSYRCTKCPNQTPPPVTIWCPFGTGYGYSNCSSKPLDGWSWNLGCDSWGWYEDITPSNLKTGLSGPLYLGSGQRDVHNLTTAGSWSTVFSNNKVAVTYTTLSSYSLGAVHFDIGCTPVWNCDPNRFKYKQTFSATSGVQHFTTAAFPVPQCNWGQQAYIIVNADFNVGHTVPAANATTFKCPAPINTQHCGDTPIWPGQGWW